MANFPNLWEIYVVCLRIPQTMAFFKLDAAANAKLASTSRRKAAPIVARQPMLQKQEVLRNGRSAGDGHHQTIVPTFEPDEAEFTKF